jgi:TonB family protein
VDRTGWICGAAIAESSGEPALDKEALKSVIQWRLIPAMREGEAVEALHRLALNFRLRDT